MPQQNANTSPAQQMELCISGVDHLCSLPAHGGRVFSELLKADANRYVIADAATVDVGLYTSVLRAVGQTGASFADFGYSIARAIDSLDGHMLGEALLPTVAAADADEPGQWHQQLGLHCVAVGCCARMVASQSSQDINPQLAYTAGLLHDIGKLAVEQQMPRSFARIAEHARAGESLINLSERKYLGVDHALVGKRLAQRWGFDEEITAAIWLHHCEPARLSGAVRHVDIIAVVRLADIIARQCRLGDSGSYDMAGASQSLLSGLGLTAGQVDKIADTLPDVVNDLTRQRQLDADKGRGPRLGNLQSAAATLARENSRLSRDNRKLQAQAGQLEFISEFIDSLSEPLEPLAVAGVFAAKWQKFFQTGCVCVYLAGDDDVLPAVVQDGHAQQRNLLLVRDKDQELVELAGEFDWLFDQLLEKFDVEKVVCRDLTYAGQVVAKVVFEQRLPGEFGGEAVDRICSAAGFVIHAVLAKMDEQSLSEKFVESLSFWLDDPEQEAAGLADGVEGSSVIEQSGLSTADQADEPLFDILAEMAAGAAHELNNPLSVIAGRAQLLGRSQDDQSNKQMLEQIHQNANQISQIANDLMSFARPASPRKGQWRLSDILVDSRDLALMKTGAEAIDLRFEQGFSGKVQVDSAQIVSAVANIIANAHYSYGSKGGPVVISTDQAQDGQYASVRISDKGCGMDSQTLRKCTYPFFSARPAGRRRGMGLSQAHRLIELNDGWLNITSKPGQGTNVTVHLPVAQ